jgi:hypothetical protein
MPFGQARDKGFPIEGGEGTPLGVVADFVSMSPEAWPAALERVVAAGIEIHDEGSDRGVRWYSCSRRGCRVGLAYCPGDGGREVTLYCSALRCWRHPLAMWRLLQDVRLALQPEN